ncbi:MAG TPA: bifunctional nicotinamidase/pyrazinamidase [Sphingobacteriaceae bacterium]|nr:bifunctional nicotinamidase/pyrazinamidase [Sphingobacteriaceae bacterium]
MECLIIVDLQNDFLPGGSLAVAGGDEIIEPINQIQENYPLVIASQDWHPAGHMSFASSHKDHQVFDVISYQDMEQVLWPDHCVQGSEGAKFSPLLRNEKIETIFRKGTDPKIDSYSAFFDNGRRKNTGLHGYLQDRGVKSLSIGGLAEDFCVYFTAMDGLDLGYEVNILSFASRAIDQQENQVKLNEFQERGGVVINR